MTREFHSRGDLVVALIMYSLPLTSILGVYAKESGDGIFFSENKKMSSDSKNINQSKLKSKKLKPHLTIVK